MEFRMKGKVISLIALGVFSMSAYAGGNAQHNNESLHDGTLSNVSDVHALCDAGKNQSPINITASVDRDLDAITFHYNPSPVRAINNGHTIQMNYAPGSYMEIGGRRYHLLQFHFHTPSEHLITGHASKMEVHLVHKSDDGHLAVVGVMLEEGMGNRHLGRLWKIMPTEVNHEVYADGSMMNVADLLPENHAYYHYRGSLTTPPCSEGVNWFVMKDSVTLSKRAVAKFHSVVGDNARPVQALHARVPMQMSK